MKAYVEQGKLAGAVVMIHQDGREVFSEAYGWRDKEASDPMREDTIFRIASQTKALTSVAVMMLMEEGKLVLDDPLGKFLPEWQKTNVAVAKERGGYDVVPAKRAITIRDLLTHTAGISYGTGPAEKAWKDAGVYGWYFADKREPVSAVVSRMAKLPMAAQPGEQWVYGYNTDILGVVVEKLSGQTLDQFLRLRLIEPLGMNDTSFCLPPEKANRFAVVYSMTRGKLERAAEPGRAAGNVAHRPGPLCRRAVRGVCRRRGACSRRRATIREIPRDAAQRRRAGRQALSLAQERRADDVEQSGDGDLPARPGLRPRLPDRDRPRQVGTAGIGGRLWLGRRLPLDLLGRSVRRA